MKRTSLLCFMLLVLKVSNSIAQSYVVEETNKMKVQPVVSIGAYAFNLRDVRLLDSPFKKAMELDVKYLLAIEPDRLLSQFLSHAGLAPKGKRYGGWESEGLAGHTLGHYLSACALEYASSDNQLFKDRVNYIVSELARSQVQRKTGYVGAIPNEDSVFNEMSKGNIRSRGFDMNGAWSPWYTVHKVMAGLLDAWLYCDNEQALHVLRGMADWTENILKNLTDEQIQKMLLCEYGGMNEILVNTYTATGDSRYLELSYKFHDKFLLDSLALKKDVLSGKHSNTQIPKVIGCARRYQLTGDQKDKTIAEFFWDVMVRQHSYATGGNSNYEYLGGPNELNDQLTDNTTETCNTYNMLKLTRQLYVMNPDAHWMDYYEKALYNHILASQNNQNGMMCYFVPLRMGGQKLYSDEFDTFTCCVGSGMENHVKYGESIYYHGKDGSLFVNLYIPSRLNWKEKGFQIVQHGNLPFDTDINFKISTTSSQELTIRFRKPAWAKQDASVKVNGVNVNATVDQQGYINLKRQWKNDDQVVIGFTSPVYQEAMPDNPNRVALFYGPILLAGVFGDKEPDPVKGIPVLVTADQDPSRWISKKDKTKLSFSTNHIGKPVDVELIPFNETLSEFYTVYWDVFSPLAWQTKQKEYEQQKLSQQQLNERIVDELRLGEMQPERDHQLMGELIETGDQHGKKWRTAKPGGNFSFFMKVNPNASNSLLCTYWGEDNRGRSFDILVDKEIIARVDMNIYRGSKFHEALYPIPKRLTQKKNSVMIQFLPGPKNSAGPVYGIRMMKE